MKVICPHCKKTIALNAKVFGQQVCPDCERRMDMNNGKVYSGIRFLVRFLGFLMFFFASLCMDSVSKALGINKAFLGVIMVSVFGILLILAELLLLKFADRLKRSR